MADAKLLLPVSIAAGQHHNSAALLCWLLLSHTLQTKQITTVIRRVNNYVPINYL